MSALEYQITGVSTVRSAVSSGADQSKYQSSASLAFTWWNHRWPVDFPHKGPVTRKMIQFNDVIMLLILPAVYVKYSADIIQAPRIVKM